MMMMMSRSKCWLLPLSVVFLLLWCGVSVRANGDGGVAPKTKTTLEENARQNNEAAVEANTAAETALKHYGGLVEDVIEVSTSLENVLKNMERINKEKADQLKESDGKNAWELIIKAGKRMSAANEVLEKLKIPGFSPVLNELEVARMKVGAAEKQMAELLKNTKSQEGDAVKMADELKTLAGNASKLWSDFVNNIYSLVDETMTVRNVLAAEVKNIGAEAEKLKDKNNAVLAEVEKDIKSPLSELSKKAEKVHTASIEGRKTATVAAEKYAKLSEKAEELSQQIQKDKHELGEGVAGKGDSSRVVVAHFAMFSVFYLLCVSVCVNV